MVPCRLVQQFNNPPNPKKQGTDCQQVQELQPNPGTPKFGVVFSKTSWWLNQPI